MLAFPLLLNFGRGGARFRRPRGLPAAFAVLLLLLVGYFLVYVTTPHDLSWHLETSLLRLFIQLWPAAIFVLFFHCSALEELKTESPARKMTGAEVLA